MSGAEVTLFTSTVYPDVARVWHACLVRALAGTEAALELFHDSVTYAPLEEWLPGVSIRRRGERVREFHEAYNDAVLRATTPVLVFVDSDLLWTSRSLWPLLRDALAAPGVAAVAAVSRTSAESHGTFSVAVKPEAYRSVLERFPDGFFPGFDLPSPGAAPETWRFRDAGDRLTEAVTAAGFEVRLLDLLPTGALVNFDSITLTRRALERFGAEPLARLMEENDYYWQGLASNAVLGRLHDRLLPDGPRYGFGFPPGPVVARALRGGARDVVRRLRYLASLAAKARRVRRFVRSYPAP